MIIIRVFLFSIVRIVGLLVVRCVNLVECRWDNGLCGLTWKEMVLEGFEKI